jgi:hypothetical protein
MNEILEVEEVVFPLDWLVAPMEYLTVFDHSLPVSGAMKSSEDAVSLIETCSENTLNDCVSQSESEIETVVDSVSALSISVGMEDNCTVCDYPSFEEFLEDETISFVNLFVQYDFTISNGNSSECFWGEDQDVISQSRGHSYDEIGGMSRVSTLASSMRQTHDKTPKKINTPMPIKEIPEQISRDNIQQLHLVPAEKTSESLQNRNARIGLEPTYESTAHTNVPERRVRKKSSLKKLNDTFKRFTNNAENSFKPWSSKIKRIFTKMQ